MARPFAVLALALSLVFSLVLRRDECVSFAEDQSRSPRAVVVEYALQERLSHNHPGNPAAIVTAGMDNRFHNTHREDVRIGVAPYALQESQYHTLHENIEIGEEVAVRIVADVVGVGNAAGFVDSACLFGAAEAVDADSYPPPSPPSRLEIFLGS
jgi:hypothetical protein